MGSKLREEFEPEEDNREFEVPLLEEVLEEVLELKFEEVWYWVELAQKLTPQESHHLEYSGMVNHELQAYHLEVK